MRQDSPRFLSLFWKATLGFVAILSSLVAVFTYFNADQLKEVQAHERHRDRQSFIVEYNGLLDNTAIQVSNLIDSLPAFESDKNSIQSRLDKHWLSLQFTWGLESAIMFDAHGKLIRRWGDPKIEPAEKTLRKTIATRSPAKDVVCSQQCYLVLSSPLLGDRGEMSFLQISITLVDTMMNFKRITGANIGFLTPSSLGENDIASIGKTGLSVSALTNHEVLQPLIRKYAKESGWQSDFMENKEQRSFVLNSEYKQYEVMFLAPPEFEENNALVMFVADTTESRNQISHAHQTYIITGLVVALISLAIAVVLLWRPIRSIQRQASALPLLPQGKYDEAKDRLLKMSRAQFFSDEITELQQTSLEVTTQLEGFHSELIQRGQKLYDMAHFDSLTGLANRAHLIEMIEEELEKVANNNHTFALIYLDLDNFKHINDALGHKIGDRLLKVVAKRLTGCLKESDFVSRLGGDEFCIILNNLHSQTQASEVAKTILKALVEPISIDGRSLSVSSSIGITIAPNDGSSSAVLMQNADLAMYQAKAAGKNNYHFFNDQLHKDAGSLIALEEELRRAVKEQEFVLYYQPQINLKTGELIGSEALIRWNHPERGVLSPFFFIDAIENNGLIIPVGKWVIQEACRQCGEWNRRGLAHLTVSINLSTRQFSDPDLINDIAQAIESSNIRPEQLEVEVTESLLATDIKHAIAVLKDLQALGLTIAIDDFGTGYSSLSNLKKLPLDKLKVDREFVKDLPDDQDDVQITKTIIAMAQSLNLSVVAEGVETAEQQDFLNDLNCEYGQGFYFAKPLSTREFVASPLVQKALEKGKAFTTS